MTVSLRSDTAKRRHGAKAPPPSDQKAARGGASSTKTTRRRSPQAALATDSDCVQDASFAQTLDRIARLPRASDTVRNAVSGLRKTLLEGPRLWLGSAGVAGSLGDMEVGALDRTLLIRIRGALNRAMPQPAEMDLRTNLRTFFAQAHARGLVPINPMLNQPAVVGCHSKLRLARERREKRLDMPDEGQIILLLSDCDDWVALADWLTMDASARPQEVRAIVWSDIKLHPRKGGKETGGNLTILRQMKGEKAGNRKRGVTLRRTKTEPGRRIVEFGPALAGHLRRLMPPPAQRHRYVVSPDGNPVDAMTLLKARKARQLRLGIAEVVGQAHGKDVLGNFFNGIKLRHAFAAKRISTGTPHTTLARQMGHDNYRITLNIYGYLFEQVAARRAAQKG